MTREREPDCTRILACPVCGEPLARAPGSLRCPRGHNHDVARQGYVDLLPPGHGRTRHEGDTAEMVAARVRFLARGHYAPLADALAAAAARHLVAAPAGRPLAVLEVGCGTGYFLGAVADALPPAVAARTCLLGMDVSRPALRLAARRVRGAAFFVNDVRHRISVADASVDVLLDIFAPRNPAEFARVVREGGLALVAIPGDGHLRELAAWVPALAAHPGKREEVARALEPDFALEGEEELARDLELPGDAVADLVLMTPTARHVDADAVRSLAAGAGGRVSARFVVLRFRRRGRSPGTTR